MRHGGRAIEAELARHLFASVVDEMGLVLMRSAFSPNIKERRDYSCALFDRRGRAVAMGDHMPVHLGSMPSTVEAVLRRARPRPGEMVAVNDPFSGGTHLPDLTLIAPYPLASPRPRYYLANRAHHSDVGGMTPGSMPPGAREIFQEGLIVPPVPLVRGGRLDPALLSIILANVRTPEEREADIRAQVASNLAGGRRLAELESRHGVVAVDGWARRQIDYSARAVRSFLRRIPDGSYSATEYLEGDGIGEGAIRLQAQIRVRRGHVTVDFSGTNPEAAGNVNAVDSITLSAVYYVFRCLVREEIPFNSGCFAAVKVQIPPRSVLSAGHPAAVAAGNVETSQRVVDLVLSALAKALPERIPAQSSGTMTNLTLGGGDPRTGRAFTYYETVAGGMGASARGPGLSAVHTHMTNSRNTPVEALEQAYPLRVIRYSVRRKSGGEGLNRGGDGVVREIQFQATGRAALLAERHRIAPGGLAGGKEGLAGRAFRLGNQGRHRISSKTSLEMRAGESIRVETPGGGGWGKRIGTKGRNRSSVGRLPP